MTTNVELPPYHPPVPPQQLVDYGEFTLQVLGEDATNALDATAPPVVLNPQDIPITTEVNNLLTRWEEEQKENLPPAPILPIPSIPKLWRKGPQIVATGDGHLYPGKLTFLINNLKKILPFGISLG